MRFIKNAIMVCFLGAAVPSTAQGFNRLRDVPERSDRDFRVQWSDSDPFEVHDGPNYSVRVHVAYETTVHGKGVLTELQVRPSAADMMSKKCQSPLNPSCIALIVISGEKDHHSWKLVMNAGQAFSRGVAFWKIGDTISLNASKTVRDDKNIPAVLYDPGTTDNATANCNSAGCYIPDKYGRPNVLRK